MLKKTYTAFGLFHVPTITHAIAYTPTYYICSNDSRLLADYRPATAMYYCYIPNQINSTRIITGSTGAVVYAAVFDPFGGMQKQWVNTYVPSLKFSGKEREIDTRLDLIH